MQAKLKLKLQLEQLPLPQFVAHSRRALASAQSQVQRLMRWLPDKLMHCRRRALQVETFQFQKAFGQGRHFNESLPALDGDDGGGDAVLTVPDCAMARHATHWRNSNSNNN